MPEYRHKFLNSWTEGKVRTFWRALIVFSAAGLLFEALFSGVFFQVLHLYRGEPVDWALPCKTYLWSIPVYGLSAALCYPPAFRGLPGFFRLPWWCRGLVYMAAIYAWEYFWGAVIEGLTGVCPWRYVDSPHAVWRYISPLFAPVWFLAGLGFERLYAAYLDLCERIGRKP